MRLKHLYKSKPPFRPASMLNTMYKKTAEMVAHPRSIPKWNFPASNWNSPKAKKKRNGPERSASDWRFGFGRNGLRIEIVLLQMCLVLMPSSSRRGGSSSKLGFAEVIVGPSCGAEKEADWATEPTSKDMKGMGFVAAGRG